MTLPARSRFVAPFLVAAAAAFSTPSFAADAFVFPVYASGSQVEAACSAMLTDMQSQADKLQAVPEANAATVLGALDAIARRGDDTSSPIDYLTAVHPDKAVRDAGDACGLKYQAFYAAFLQNERIYKLLKEAQPTDDIDRQYQRDLLDQFEDSGVGLPADKQQRAKDLNQQITKLSQDFQRRVQEDKTLVPFTAKELGGVPRGVWQKAKRDPKGRYLLGLDYPTSGPVIEHANDPKARERMWRALYARGGEANLTDLASLAQLRREYAGLFGFDSYADFILRRRMARSEAEVQKLLANVHDAVDARERSDVELLRRAKAQQLKIKGDELPPLNRWDVNYYMERARIAKYNVDQEQFRQYFPPEASLKFVFAVANRLFGVDFKPVQQTLWYPEARAFIVVDSASGKTLGNFYIDMYPRADKYSHAAMWQVRNVSTLAERTPAAALAVNFDRKGLTIEELETLLHEFGHGLHGLLSQTRYLGEGGTAVQTDFVEAPSQMLEDWVYDPQVLALFQQVCASCKPVPAALLDKASRARHFGKGITTARQYLYASYDLALYGKKPEEPMALWARMEGATPIGHVKGSMFPASFNHIAANYAAGYYSYLWSLVVADDLRTAFAGHKLDPAVGKRYRDSVLANGGQVPPAELITRFLGRPLDSKAFYDELNKQ